MKRIDEGIVHETEWNEESNTSTYMIGEVGCVCQIEILTLRKAMGVACVQSQKM